MSNPRLFFARNRTDWSLLPAETSVLVSYKHARYFFDKTTLEDEIAFENSCNEISKFLTDNLKRRRWGWTYNYKAGGTDNPNCFNFRFENTNDAAAKHRKHDPVTFKLLPHHESIADRAISAQIQFAMGGPVDEDYLLDMIP